MLSNDRDTKEDMKYLKMKQVLICTNIKLHKYYEYRKSLKSKNDSYENMIHRIFIQM